MSTQTASPHHSHKGSATRIWLFTIALAYVFIAGFCVFFFPTYSEWLAAYNATTASQTYFEGTQALSPDELARSWEQARDYNAKLKDAPLEDPYTTNLANIDPFSTYPSVLNTNNMMGVLQIPSINVSLPIRHGTSDEVLTTGAGHLMQTALPLGEIGIRPVLTTHTGLPGARLFTDLDKMKLGDIFRVYVLDTRLSYRVDSIEVIQPEDISRLAAVPGEDRVTLLTCTPYGINSHRLLVTGIRFDEAPDALPSAPHKEFPWNLVLPPVALVAVVVLIPFMTKPRKQQNSSSAN